MPTEEKNRRSVPTPVIPASISVIVDATVISRSGSPSAPPAIRRPVAPTENSPLIGFAPRMDARHVLDQHTALRLASISSNDSSPGST